MESNFARREKRSEIKSAIAYALLFSATAPIVGYLNLYLQRRGLTDAQIGTTAAVMSLVSIIAPPLWGYLSDRWNDRRLPIVIASFGAAIVFLAFLAVPFPIVLLIAAIFALFNNPLIPLLDALVLEQLGETKERYGRIRAWGSWAFIAMMVLFGATLKKHGTAENLIPALLTFVLLRLALGAMAFTLPRNDGGKPMRESNWRSVKELFSDRDWQIFLAISLLSMVSISAWYAFFPLYLNRAGVTDNWQGYFWVIAVLAEVAFMAWLTEPLMKRIGLKGVLLLGIAGRAIRLIAYAFPLSFPTLITLQLFHSLTFAAFHTASVTWVSIKAPPTARALTQTIYASVLMGIGSAFGAQVGGYIAENFGLRFLFGLAGAINGLALLLGWIWLREPTMKSENFSPQQGKALVLTCDTKGGCKE
ncbi:MAG: MFS transporter [Armatimonadetes bacterium]|nr:MFS transporter [Armatimonadota bacterium]MCX7968432.1 MFS transporter [Armatimonadota bacterium]MDW8143055.1 MFS transporter [Armatimonadota bacterium]